MELDREVIETEAGDYVVVWEHDEDGEQPYDEGFGVAVLGGRRYVDVVSDADHADEIASLIRYHRQQNAYDGNIYDHEVRSSAAIARYLRLKYGIQGIVAVTTHDYTPSEPSADRGEGFDGLAWAPSDATDPDAYVRAALRQWSAWAEGDKFGWRVLDPSGNEVQSVWGYFGYYADDSEQQYTLSEAKSEIEADVAERKTAANLVGAGIVGIV